jgi:hypothetical protein
LEHWFRSTHSGQDTIRRHGIQLALGKHIEHFSACDGDGPPGAPLTCEGAGSPGAPALYSTRMMLPILDHFGQKNCFESP